MVSEELNHCDYVIHKEGKTENLNYYTSKGIDYLSENYKDGTAIPLRECKGGYSIYVAKSEADDLIKAIIFLFIFFILLILYISTIKN